MAEFVYLIFPGVFHKLYKHRTGHPLYEAVCLGGEFGRRVSKFICFAVGYDCFEMFLLHRDSVKITQNTSADIIIYYSFVEHTS